MKTVTDEQTLSLRDLPANSVGSIVAVHAPAEQFTRLVGLGLAAGRDVRVVKRGEPMIVQVYGTRIGLAQSIAGCVQVLGPDLATD